MIAPGESYFRSAILDANGDVDVGYYSLAWGLRVWIASIIVVLLIGCWAVWKAVAPVPAILESMGVASIAMSGGFAAMIGAVGGFLWGDKPRAATPGTVTTTQKIVQTEIAPIVPAATEALARGTPDKPLHVAVEDDPTPTKRRAKP